MAIELEREHWEQAKLDNKSLILQSMMNIAMAEKVLVMIEEKLAKFPAEKKEVPRAVG